MPTKPPGKPSKPTARKGVKLLTVKGGARSVVVWAAFDPDTGECMLPTVLGWKAGAIAERDRLYPGCPIYECWLSASFPVEYVAPAKRKGGMRGKTITD